MTEQCFCLRWNNYHSSVLGDLKLLLEQEEFVDVTISCDGRRLKAHRLMLSACSTYFEALLKENPCDHPIIVLKDVRFWEIESIMDFIYNGQVNVMQEQLPGFIRTAEALQIKGLAAVNHNNNVSLPKISDLKQMQEAYLHQNFWKDNLKLRQLDYKRHIISPISQSNKHQKITNGFINKVQIPPLNKDNMKINASEDLSPALKVETSCSISSKSENDSLLGSDSTNNTELKKFSSNGIGEKEGLSEDSNDRLEINSRSGSPSEIERSQHDDSMTQIDGLKDVDWNSLSNEQSHALSISLNDAGLPVCKICGKVFKHQGSLVAHYQVHQQRTKCPVCKKVLSRHYHMKVHLLTVHKVPDSQIEGLLRSQNIT